MSARQLFFSFCLVIMNIVIESLPIFFSLIFVLLFSKNSIELDGVGDVCAVEKIVEKQPILVSAGVARRHSIPSVFRNIGWWMLQNTCSSFVAATELPVDVGECEAGVLAQLCCYCLASPNHPQLILYRQQLRLNRYKRRQCQRQRRNQQHPRRLRKQHQQQR